ncbi:MAG: energy transducer TonB [Acidobacteria bacterium]|nr:energy transducer TonB [Acidobacteriota bacterium]
MSVHHPAHTARSAPCAPEVYSADEVAHAAGVDRSVIRRLIAAGEVATVDGVFVAEREVVRAARRLRRGPISSIRPVFGGALLDRDLGESPSGAVSAAMSTLAHGALVPLLVMLTAVQMTTAADRASDAEGPALARLVFVAEPGPGGGGGGGGLRQPLPPPRAERRGESRTSSPVPPREEPVAVEPIEEPRPPEPLEREALPRIVAPLMAMRADVRDLRGLLDLPPATGTVSSGPGRDGGVGAGAGRGVGSGSGAGVGPGSGGGAGGGPYRMGSGISPPAIRHEVKPVYTADALRREIEGDIVLEVVVLANGDVGEIRIVRGLGYGLDETAVNAMRQWRFHPARRQGATVDVVVEVAMEFRLR